MTNKKSLLAGIIDHLWREPKGRLSGRLKKACDEMPHQRRLTVVTVMLSLFVVIAFIVFGHACYRIGARQAMNEIEVQHLGKIELPEVSSDMKKNLPISDLNASAYDDSGMESED